MDDFHTPVRRPRLPDVALPALPALASGARVPLRAPRRASVLVLLDDTPEERDLAYVRELAEAERALADWDGRVLVVVGGPATAMAHALTALALPFPVLVDAEGHVATGAATAAPAIVVTDQWGEIHVRAPVGPDRPWLAVAELEKWLRYLAIRCAG
jgi:hypothetical protein